MPSTAASPRPFPADPAPATAPAHGVVLRMLLGDQLNPDHSWFRCVDAQVVYLMLEMRQETDYVRHHAQKVIGIFAAMRDFARQLRASGHRVRYVAIDDPSNRQTLAGNLDALCRHYQATAFVYQAPDEWRLDQDLAEWCARQAMPCHAVDSEHFYTTRTDAAQLFQGRAHWLLEHFYRHLRRREGVLLDAAGQPLGGRWNFDADNRKPWRGTPPEPPDPRPVHDHRALWAQVQAAGVQTVGAAQAEAFRWPLNQAEALQQLEAFIQHGLPHFGDYQDALSSRGWRLFHSLLSFALNTKMLSPRVVVQRAQQACLDGHAPLAAVEGFVRQILGWREFVRGVYWADMPGYTERNALGHQLPLPPWFWSGDTGMACMAAAIGQTLQHAYAHHIQRLMVIGNFALLAGLSPAEVHRWYLGVYIDAFEWVEAPNTLGMSQYADGGRFATKPYVASAAYLQRMGDHCAGCRYDPRQKTGPQACPFNALYWDFYVRHAERLQGNPRIGMAYQQLRRMAPAQLQALREHAQAVRAGLHKL
jgi:deoxyribodipyrimidine photolyase-related protein